MTSPSKAWAIVLLLASLPVGFILGSWLGAQWLVPDDAGLAGGAMVFWYALFGMIISLVLAIIVVTRCSAKQIKPVALIMLISALVGLSFFGFMLQQQQSEQAEQQQSTLSQLPEMRLKIERWKSEDIAQFTYQSDLQQIQVAYSDQRRCSIRLYDTSASEVHLDLLKALRALDVSGLLIDPSDCHHTGTELAAVDFTIVEARPPTTSGQLRITQACLDEQIEFDHLVRVIGHIHNQQARRMNCIAAGPQ